jgi:pimeloyl-ACP methyl ester carboxylesterase
VGTLDFLYHPRPVPWDPQRARGVVLRVVAMLLGLYTVALLLAWALQEKLLFHPEPLAADHAFDFGADVHEVSIEVPGATLHALHLRNPAPRAVIFYLHGNAGNLQNWFAHVDQYRSVPVDLFMIDYRSYGKSTGSIDDEAQLYADVRAAWDTFAPQYDGVPKIILGRSLGTALAARLASDVEPELTVLVSPYRSIVAMADLQFPWIPSFLLRYPRRTEDDIAGIDGPLLVIHGERDSLIPIAHAEAIVAKKADAELVRIPDAGHNDVHEFPMYWETLGAAISTAMRS